MGKNKYLDIDALNVMLSEYTENINMIEPHLL